jgi:iron complex transport system permease protein
MKKNTTFFIILLNIVIFIAAIYFGAVKFNSDNMDIILKLRLPRIIMAFIIGGALGMSGALFQLVLKNPLADGFTTGVASSSALGAVVAISIGFPVFLIPVIAFVSGMTGLAIVYKISKKSSGLNSVTLILAGIVLNIITSSIISFLKYYFDESVGTIVFWLMGGFYQFDITKILIVLFVTLFFFIFFFKNGLKLNVLSFDDITASNMGINHKFFKQVVFVGAAFLTAISVSFSGIIAFVGLIVPHIVRGVFGSNMKKVILYSTIFGADLTLISDTVSRSIIPSGAELPVGIITSIVGGGFFIYILLKKRERIWNG